jgi:glycosyltransferase involved in cell wall biosynthesis
MPAQPVIRVVPLQPHCFAFGGFEVQMIAAMESARAAGANIAPLDFWRSEADFDVLHLWGLELQHANTARWAHAEGKKIVVSALVSYPGWRSTLRYLASSVVGPARLRTPMLANLDCITVVNDAQARYLTGTVGIAAAKIAVVPNLVDDIFFAADKTGPAEAAMPRNSVLCCGNVCARKNQLALIAACRRLGVPLVLAGEVLAGEEEYGRAVAAAISAAGFEWLHGLRPGSAELARVYRRAAVFALPSHQETQPISALEAAAAGKPLVLADLPYARQSCYQNAVLADPHSESSIAAAIRRAFDHPDAHRVPATVIDQCRAQRVGAAYAAIYQRLFQGAA